MEENINQDLQKELQDFLKDRFKYYLKDKEIRYDIIEATLSSFSLNNLFSSFEKAKCLNKVINTQIGIDINSSYKRASNILDQETLDSKNGPNAVLFKQDEEKELFDRINNIRKVLTLREERKDYEKHLRLLSETKSSTDKFFDKVKVNDENQDLKNNNQKQRMQDTWLCFLLVLFQYFFQHSLER